MLVKADQELTHNATDASYGHNVPLVIQPDLHGLTIELPDGTIITLDVNAGEANLYVNGPEGEADGNLIHSTRLRKTEEC